MCYFVFFGVATIPCKIIEFLDTVTQSLHEFFILFTELLSKQVSKKSLMRILILCIPSLPSKTPLFSNDHKSISH